MANRSMVGMEDTAALLVCDRSANRRSMGSRAEQCALSGMYLFNCRLPLASCCSFSGPQAAAAAVVVVVVVEAASLGSDSKARLGTPPP